MYLKQLMEKILNTEFHFMKLHAQTKTPNLNLCGPIHITEFEGIDPTFTCS